MMTLKHQGPLPPERGLFSASAEAIVIAEWPVRRRFRTNHLIPVAIATCMSLSIGVTPIQSETAAGVTHACPNAPAGVRVC
jgi:hypothetical protein